MNHEQKNLALPQGDLEKITDLIQTIYRLRAPGGCPWDIKQTHQSLRRHLIEEAHEVVDVLDLVDPDTKLREDKRLAANLKEELGDVWMQVLLHSQLAHESGAFSIYDVAAALNEKLIRRHPHVFGTQASEASTASNGEPSLPGSAPQGRGAQKPLTPDEVLTQWEQIKAQEKRNRLSVEPTTPDVGEAPSPSVLDGLPKGLPALQKSTRVIERVTQVGFQWPDLNGPLEKVAEEMVEFQEELKTTLNLMNAPSAEQSTPSALPQARKRLEAELGDILFSLCNVASFLKISPEDALRSTLAKFERRFRFVEQSLAREGRSPRDSTLQEMDRYWEKAKEIEKTLEASHGTSS
jgi:tetrapyrrole methylase family protein/MazG family protein